MESVITIHIMKMTGTEDVPLPQKMSAAAAGFDLYAALPVVLILQPGKRALIPTGFALALPDNMEAQIRPRSGLALNHGVTCLNAPGTIDADYRGEIGVVLINHGEDDFTISRGDRIAQMVIQFLPEIHLEERSNLPESTRNTGGFGHTGI